MFFYILKRLLLIIPTLFFIILLNFFIIQTAPGGPVEKFIAMMNHATKAGSEAAGGGNVGFGGGRMNAQNIDVNLAKNSNDAESLKYQGSVGIDPEILQKVEKLYGFDLPLWQRFWLMIKKFLQFDFGVSFYQDKKVSDLIIEKLPVSISLGLWATLLTYLIAIPLGIKKAVRDGSKFDVYSSAAIIIGYAIPSFLFAILLIILFAGGNFLNIFPLRGLVSSDFAAMSCWQKIADYFWHLTLPIIAMIIGGFASLTFFCKNSFLEEIKKNYVLAAYARGLNQKQVLYNHVFRNAMMIIIAQIPAALVAVIFTSAFLIEIVFSLDGLGMLGYEAAISRDYPIMFGTLYLFTLIGLILTIISDITYKLVDPRVNFQKR